MTPNELKELITDEEMIQLMRKLGATSLQDHGGYFTFPSICHNEHEKDAKFNLAYYKDTKLFHCFSGCGETFDIYGLLRRRWEKFDEDRDTHLISLFYYVYNHLNIEQADGIVEEFEQFIHEKADDYKPLDTQYNFPRLSLHLLEPFFNYYPIEWIDDNISEETMRKFHISFSPSRNAIIIPHYDVNGILIGIRVRNLNPEIAERFGKYRPLSMEGRTYSHPLGFNLYGLNKNLKNIQESKVAIIVEGEKAVLQAETLMDKNVAVAVCGSSFNRWQLMLLMKYSNVEEIIFAFDNEEEDGSSDYFNKMYNMCEKYNKYVRTSFIYDTENIPRKQNIFDVYQKDLLDELIQRRTKVK